MDLTALIDANGGTIVLGGTLLATVAGSGRRELGAACAAVLGLLKRPFSYDRARSEIAHDVAAIRHDGLLRSQPFRSSDSELASVADALIHDRSLASLVDAHERFRRERTASRREALKPIALAGEMAPVFGMAGTLFSLSQLQYDGTESLVLMASVAMAILTTLYGLLLAHLVFNPLARLIDRRGVREEADRQLLIDWLARQLAGTCPPPKGAARLERVV